MACIDKIYCYSKNDFIEFYNWCMKFNDICLKETQLSLLDNFYTTPETYDTDFDKYTNGVPITDFNKTQDKWLLYHCPIRWIRDYLLSVQYPNMKLKKEKINLFLDRG